MLTTRAATADSPTETECRLALRDAGLFARADVAECWPLATLEVLALLDAGEYMIDADRLTDLARRGFLVPPPDGRWCAAGVCQLGGVLEALRLWKPFSETHAAKKTEPQRLLEEVRADGEVEKAVAMFPKRSLRFVLLLMTESDNRQMREQLLCHVKLQLEHDHGVYLE